MSEKADYSFFEMLSFHQCMEVVNLYVSNAVLQRSNSLVHRSLPFRRRPAVGEVAGLHDVYTRVEEKGREGRRGRSQW